MPSIANRAVAEGKAPKREAAQRIAALERKNAALEREVVHLRAMEEAAGQLDLILNNSPQAMAIHRGAQPLFVNPAFARMLGFAGREQALALPNIIGVVHPEDREFVAAQMKARIAGRDFLPHYECRARRVDGAAIWLDCHVTRIAWHGQPASLVSLNDITDRKRFEESQRRSEKLFGTVFRASPDPVSLTTMADGRYVDVNESFLRCWGWERSKVIGRTSEEIGFWQDTTFRARMVEALRRDGFVRDLESKVRTPGGQIRDFSYSIDVIHFAGEELLLGVGRDVTDMRRNAEELRRSKESAELANRAKSEFLANMSHELRTPLNAILGFSEIIGGEMFGPQELARYVDYGKDIYASGKLLLQIIDDLLDLSRLENGKLEIRTERTEVAGTIAACLRLVEGRAREGRVKLVVDLPAAPLWLEADALRLKQVLLNLLSNAVKFTPPGGKVTLGAQPAEAGGVAFFVADTGIGMNPSEIAVAMQPFGQVANAMTRPQQGTGLGLPLAKCLVELHGGSLAIESRPGTGTRVTVTLPPGKIATPGAPAIAGDTASGPIAVGNALRRRKEDRYPA